MVSKYSGLDFNSLTELDCFTFRCLLRDSIIYEMEQTEEGRDYLEKCWTMKQTKPDYSKLKEQFEVKEL